MLSFRPPVPWVRASLTASKQRANPVEAYNRAAGEMKFDNAFDPGKVLRSQVDQVYVWILLIEFLAEF